MVESIFLTDSRRDVLEGTTDLTDQSLYNAKSRIRTRARLAIGELIEVAASSEIDNDDIFTEQQMQVLISNLLFGSGGLMGDDVADDLPEAWDPDPEYASNIYTILNTQTRKFERRHMSGLDIPDEWDHEG